MIVGKFSTKNTKKQNNGEGNTRYHEALLIMRNIKFVRFSVVLNVYGTQ